MDTVQLEDFWACESESEALAELHEVEEAEKAVKVKSWIEKYEEANGLAPGNG